MNTFNYRAKDKLGKVVLGQIEAVDDRQAAVMLRNRGLFVVDIKIRSGLLEAATAIQGWGFRTGVGQFYPLFGNHAFYGIAVN